jgi:putative hydrolase of the HAD superfamily
MPRAVVFDIGGVLEITPPTGYIARWEQSLGLGAGELHRTTEDVWSRGRLGTLSLDEVHRALAERLGLSPADLDRFMTEFWDEYVGTPNTELIDYFRSLRTRVRTGIVSNSFVGARERERERYGFEDMTDVIVYSHEFGTAKPEPAIFLSVCERLEVAPADAVFVDDKQGAVDGARAIGMNAVLFRDNAQVISDVESLLARGPVLDPGSMRADRLP